MILDVGGIGYAVYMHIQQEQFAPEWDDHFVHGLRTYLYYVCNTNISARGDMTRKLYPCLKELK
jgi:hypothetical protein